MLNYFEITYATSVGVTDFLGIEHKDTILGF